MTTTSVQGMTFLRLSNISNQKHPGILYVKQRQCPPARIDKVLYHSRWEVYLRGGSFVAKKLRFSERFNYFLFRVCILCLWLHTLFLSSIRGSVRKSSRLPPHSNNLTAVYRLSHWKGRVWSTRTDGEECGRNREGTPYAWCVTVCCHAVHCRYVFQMNPLLAPLQSLRFRHGAYLALGCDMRLCEKIREVGWNAPKLLNKTLATQRRLVIISWVISGLDA